jgi:3-oxoacyl-[acyl-carrier protein] reductase
VATFGKLDILVNNAGIFETGPIGDTTYLSRFDCQRAINVGGAVTVIREGWRVMTAGGRIISMSSRIAAQAVGPDFADYAASKAAVKGYI